MPDTMLRSELLNQIILAFDYESYLEIGLQYGKTFDAVVCRHKVSVDHNGDYRPTFTGTSDEFFSRNRQLFDVIFIDGWHEEYQVLRDVHNSLTRLTDHGVVMLHDVNPHVQEQQVNAHPGGALPWCGTVWKAWVRLRQQLVAPEMFVVDTDYGCGVIVPWRTGVSLDPTVYPLTWEGLVKNRDEWLNLISVDQFLGHLAELAPMTKKA